MEADPELAFGAFLRCGACGTLFTDRVPSPTALGRFYGAYSGTARSLAKIRSKLGLETRRLFCLRLAARGVLFLTTPDAGHRTVRGNQLRWGMVCPPEHLTLFTRDGARAALAPHFRRVIVLPNRKPGVRVLAFKGKS